MHSMFGAAADALNMASLQLVCYFADVKVAMKCLAPAETSRSLSLPLSGLAFPVSIQSCIWLLLLLVMVMRTSLQATCTLLSTHMPALHGRRTWTRAARCVR